MVILCLQLKEMVEIVDSEIQKLTGNLIETHGLNQVLMWSHPFHGDPHSLLQVKVLVIQVNRKVLTLVRKQ